MNKKKIILAAGVVLVLAVAGFWIFGKKNAQGKVDFVTEKLHEEISAIPLQLQEPSNRSLK